MEVHIKKGSGISEEKEKKGGHKQTEGTKKFSSEHFISRQFSTVMIRKMHLKET